MAGYETGLTWARGTLAAEKRYTLGARQKRGGRGVEGPLVAAQTAPGVRVINSEIYTFWAGEIMDFKRCFNNRNMFICMCGRVRDRMLARFVPINSVWVYVCVCTMCMAADAATRTPKRIMFSSRTSLAHRRTTLCVFYFAILRRRKIECFSGSQPHAYNGMVYWRKSYTILVCRVIVNCEYFVGLQQMGKCG